MTTQILYRFQTGHLARENCGIIRKQASTDGGVLWKIVSVNVVQVRRKYRSLRDPREARYRVRISITNFSWLQLALEVINDIPVQALIIYTDGSRSDMGRAGSGIFSNTPGNDVKIGIRNPDHCSVFRSEHCYQWLGQRKLVCLQWFPSHVGEPENEAADELAGRGCDLPNPSSSVLIHIKIHSL
ncbi:ribonuclease H1 [Trichonephila clavipes]|nr:ribonuclease H1 [Trichonephila clavipes]